MIISSYPENVNRQGMASMAHLTTTRISVALIFFPSLDIMLYQNNN